MYMEQCSFNRNHPTEKAGSHGEESFKPVQPLKKTHIILPQQTSCLGEGSAHLLCFFLLTGVDKFLFCFDYGLTSR